jgi:hypothetical protein
MPDTAITPELFNAVNAELSRFIKEKLKVMQFDVTDLELHNSSLTKTVRAYITVKRTTNLKALSLAEQILVKEIEAHFRFRFHAFYWRYLAE